MIGTGTITVLITGISRTQWDALLFAISTFKVAHPEITSVNSQYVENTSS